MGTEFNNWQLIGQIFVPGNGSEIDIDEIRTRLIIIS
jgi:hypothetical protein